MPWMIGGAILGSSLIGANSANNAAQTQANAAGQATQAQLDMFNTQNQQQAPYRQTGYNALNQIGALGSGTYGMVDQNGQTTGTGTGSGYLTQQSRHKILRQGLILAMHFDYSKVNEHCKANKIKLVVL